MTLSHSPNHKTFPLEPESDVPNRESESFKHLNAKMKEHFEARKDKSVPFTVNYYILIPKPAEEIKEDQVDEYFEARREDEDFIIHTYPSSAKDKAHCGYLLSNNCLDAYSEPVNMITRSRNTR